VRLGLHSCSSLQALQTVLLIFELMFLPLVLLIPETYSWGAVSGSEVEVEETGDGDGVVSCRVCL
jgi:hypothetical protein